MNKHLLLLMPVLLLVSNVYSKQWRPIFEMDTEQGLHYIKLAAQWGLCGGLTLKQKKAPPKGELWLRAFRYKRAAEGAERAGEADIGLTRYPEGRRFWYDCASKSIIWPKAHYRIYCFAKHLTAAGGVGEEIPLDCKEYIEILDIKHNRACVIGPAGPSKLYIKAEKKPLNMNKA